MLLGAHVSIAGGLIGAFDRADAVGADALQIFTQNGRGWAPTIRDHGEIREFAAEAGRRATPLLAHGSYLVNLASGDPELRLKSRAAFLAELERCEALGVQHLVFHPGAHCGDGVGAGLRRVGAAMRWAIARTPGYRVSLLVEVMAGQGTCLGHRFAEVRALLDAAEPVSTERTGVCFDTCHAWAAGYDLRSPRGYDEVWRELDEVIGIARVRAFHLNDSKRERGARVDRHEEIAAGALGSAAFRRLVRDPRFAAIPAVLELPPEVVPANLARLRSYRPRAHTKNGAAGEAQDARRR